MRPGTILYLNGSSSAGKSSLARSLQDVFDEPILHVGIDTLFGGVTPRFNRTYRAGAPERASWRGTGWMLDEDGRVASIAFDAWGRRMTYGLHGMVAALAREGNHVVVDDVIFEPDMARHAARVLAPLGAYLIGVRCPLEVLEARERDRGDRLPGLARYLHRRPHDHVARYDLEVDTSAASPTDCAWAIRRHVDSGAPAGGFRSIVDGADPGRPGRGKAA